MPRLVAIDAGLGAAFVTALVDAWDRGDAVLPVDQRLPPQEAQRLVKRLRVGGDVEPGDALVVATSGSTGEPKGAVLTHDAVAAAARAVTARIDELAGDGYGWLACLPLAHVGGLGVVTRAVVTGRPVSVLASFDAHVVEHTARSSRRPLAVALVTTALRRVDPALFHWIVLGGSTPPPDLPANASATYGLTETGGGIVYDGRPLDGVEVRIADDGEIHVRGPMLLRGYRDGTNPLVDGWLATGDLGRLDTDGRLDVSGRREDLIISGGENVWPGPVEDVIRGLAGVADVAVLGRDDEEWGERVVAVVVAERGMDPPTLREIRAAVKERLPAWYAPSVVELRTSIPRTALGKVRRREITRKGPPTNMR